LAILEYLFGLETLGGSRDELIVIHCEKATLLIGFRSVCLGVCIAISRVYLLLLLYGEHLGDKLLALL
jgi:hypothetical protein